MNIGGERQIETDQIADQSYEADYDEAYIIILSDVHPPIREQAPGYYADYSTPV